MLWLVETREVTKVIVGNRNNTGKKGELYNVIRIWTLHLYNTSHEDSVIYWNIFPD